MSRKQIKWYTLLLRDSVLHNCTHAKKSIIVPQSYFNLKKLGYNINFMNYIVYYSTIKPLNSFFSKHTTKFDCSTDFILDTSVSYQFDQHFKLRYET